MDQRLRFVTDSDCRLDVARVTLTTLGDDSFSVMRAELVARGFNRTDRKYLVWVDAAVGICGLGAVQPDARHPSAAWHCTDEADVMCYDDDGGGPTVMTTICPPEHEALLDCSDDDCFNTSPPAGNYLATHWNTASSSFLQRATASSTRLTVTGSVAPNHKGQRVYLQRLAGGTWKGVATAVLTSASAYTLRARPRGRGPSATGWSSAPTATTRARPARPSR